MLRTRVLGARRVSNIWIVVYHAGVSVVVDTMTCDFVNLHLAELLFVFKSTFLFHFESTEFSIVLFLSLTLKRIFLE